MAPEDLRHSLARQAESVARMHWLLFNQKREVVGCHCGFAADEDDEGWGDSVVEHLLGVDDGLSRFQDNGSK